MRGRVARDRTMISSVALLGFGEAAAVVADLAHEHGWPGTIVACLAGREPSPATRARLNAAKVELLGADRALRASELVLSLVPPGQALVAVEAVTPWLRGHHIFADLTSTNSDTARRACEHVEATGADFVKGSILGPVPVQRQAVPLAIAGSRAEALITWLADIGFREIVHVPDIADAASVKMLWSVITKGLIGLYAESLVAAERMGVLKALLTLLRSQLGFFGSPTMVERLLISSVVSGSRRVDEMREVAAALGEVGVPANSIPATTEWLRRLAALDGGRLRQAAPTHGSRTEAVVRSVSTALATTDTVAGARETKGP